jgi:hypothetical protein
MLFLIYILFMKTKTLLVPGFGGSKLLHNNVVVYPPKLVHVFLKRKLWINTMNNALTTLEFGDKKALDLYTNIPFFEKKNIYKDIKDVYPIPYDFRLVHKKEYIDLFYEKLTNYIENFNETISIVCHSLGCLVTHFFLIKKTDKWKKKTYKKCSIHKWSVFRFSDDFGRNYTKYLY